MQMLMGYEEAMELPSFLDRVAAQHDEIHEAIKQDTAADLRRVRQPEPAQWRVRLHFGSTYVESLRSGSAGYAVDCAIEAIENWEDIERIEVEETQSHLEWRMGK